MSEIPDPAYGKDQEGAGEMVSDSVADLELLTKEHMVCLRRGDILGSLRKVPEIAQTARQNHAPISQEIIDTVLLLRRIRGKTGEFRALFSRAAGALSAEIQAERREIASQVDRAIASASSPIALGAMSTGDLIAFARTLERERRGRTVNSSRIIEIQRAIIAKNPHDIEARFHLIKALQNAEVFDEASRELTEIDRGIVEGRIHLTEEMIERLAQCKRRMRRDEGPIAPARYEDFTEERMPLCSLDDLERYSKQAWFRNDWQRVLYFTDIIHKRGNGASLQNCIAHAHALAQLGRLEEALRYNIEVIDLLVKDKPEDRRRNDRVIENLRRKLNLTSITYSEVHNSVLRSSTNIGEILRWSMHAEQAGAWDRVVAFRKRLTELEPGNAAGYVVLGTALEHLGQFAEAIQMTREKLLPLLQDPERVAKTNARIAKWARLLEPKENV